MSSTAPRSSASCRNLAVLGIAYVTARSNSEKCKGNRCLNASARLLWQIPEISIKRPLLRPAYQISKVESSHMQQQLSITCQEKGVLSRWEVHPVYVKYEIPPSRWQNKVPTLPFRVSDCDNTAETKTKTSTCRFNA